jgi:hypothetical protein
VLLGQAHDLGAVGGRAHARLDLAEAVENLVESGSSRMAAPARRPARSSTAWNADVVTLALAGDIDAIAKRSKKLPATGRRSLPNNNRALHLDDRVPGPQGQPQGRSRTGATW